MTQAFNNVISMGGDYIYSQCCPGETISTKLVIMSLAYASPQKHAYIHVCVCVKQLVRKYPGLSIF